MSFILNYQIPFDNLNHGFCKDCFPGFDPCLPVSHLILYQSAALPPLAAPAQTWKLTTANMNTFLASTAAAASALIHVG